MTITFTVPGNPVPKGRPRSTRTGRTYTPAKTRAAEEAVAWRARTAMKGRKPFDFPVAVTVHFAVPDRRHRDLDNMCKTVCDAMNKIVYTDDNHVVELHATKSVSGSPQTEVSVGIAYGTTNTAAA